MTPYILISYSKYRTLIRVPISIYKELISDKNFSITLLSILISPLRNSTGPKIWYHILVKVWNFQNIHYVIF